MFCDKSKTCFCLVSVYKPTSMPCRPNTYYAIIYNLKMYHTKRGCYIKVSETCLDVAGPVCAAPSLPGLVSAITRACSWARPPHPLGPGAALHSHRLPLLLCGQGGQGGTDCSRGCHGIEAGLGHIAIVIVVKKKNYCWKLFKINKQI